MSSPSYPAILRDDGFTLLELLVALAIFGLLAALAYSGLNNVMHVRAATEQHTQRLAQLQTAFLWLERDIEQTVNRPVRDGYGEQLRAVHSEELGHYQLEVTRAGWRNPAARARSNLQRIAYGIDDNQLIRYAWPVLDRAQDTEPLPTVLLDGVDKLELRFLDAQRQWSTVWPRSGHGGELAQGQPIAVEVTLETTAEGRIMRLFRVPGSL